MDPTQQHETEPKRRSAYFWSCPPDGPDRVEVVGVTPEGEPLWLYPEALTLPTEIWITRWGFGYFHYANSGEVFSKVQWQTRAHIRRWLWKKHAKTREQYGKAYSNERLHNHHGLINFPMYTKWKNS